MSENQFNWDHQVSVFLPTILIIYVTQCGMKSKNVALEYCILACDILSFNLKCMLSDNWLSNLKRVQHFIYNFMQFGVLLYIILRIHWKALPFDHASA